MGKAIRRPRIPLKTEDLGDLENKLPEKSIDLKEVLYWMDLGATQEEIAGSRHVSVDTLSRRLKEHTGLTFAELKEKCCGTTKLKLRQNQLRLSEKNATMGIWLGKQWLGQRDIPKEIEEFNGTLALLLEQLKSVESMEEFKAKGVEEKSDDKTED